MSIEILGRVCGARATNQGRQIISNLCPSKASAPPSNGWRGEIKKRKKTIEGARKKRSQITRRRE
jgi:hypothetical protein